MQKAFQLRVSLYEVPSCRICFYYYCLLFLSLFIYYYRYYFFFMIIIVTISVHSLILSVICLIFVYIYCAVV